jgi:hypothetical protein
MATDHNPLFGIRVSKSFVITSRNTPVIHSSMPDFCRGSNAEHN